MESLEALIDVEVPEVDTDEPACLSRWPAPDRGRLCPERPTRVRRGQGGHGNAERAPRRRPRVTPAASETSDEALLVRLRGGDAAAGEALVGRYYGPLMRYLQRVAGTRSAEDLHQQTWLSVLAHIDRFAANSDGASFKGWLFRIAANKTKDHWRSATREKAAKEGFGRMTAGDESPWAGHAANTREQCEELLAALVDLPDAQREVLMLRYYSDMKFADIAAILDCPINTALTRAHKALIKLRGAMAREPAGGCAGAGGADAVR